VHARSALFDLYGDHLRERGGQAPVAALVRLLAPLGIAPPAVRTAVSRMVRQGWLDPVALPGGRGYRATPRCLHRLDEALARVYRVEAPRWDGCWHLLVLERVPERGTRERLRAALGYLGYAALADSTWVAPHGSPEVSALLASEGVRAERFTAQYVGDAAALVLQAWDLAELGRTYERWLVEAAELVGPRPTRGGSDPGLPTELLPALWPGARAAEFFSTEAERLRPAATRFVDACLAPS
jgi:phenylacetic acid degradation operon negative regulatory protein